MKVLYTVIILLSLLLAAGGVSAEAETVRILVTFEDPGMSRSARAGPVRPGYSRRGSNYLVSVNVRRAARRLERAFDLQLIDEWPIDPLKIHCIVYDVDATRDVGALIGRLSAQPGVESAQRMNTFEVLSDAAVRSPDRYAELQHNMMSLHIEAAHQWSRGDGSRVAIIDTGADIGHPDLRDQIEMHADFTDDNGAGFEDDAHGTAIAGIIGASSENGIGITGVAPAASLSILRACWYVDRQAAAVCDTFTLAKALSFAIDSPAKVINLSLGGPEDPLLERLVVRALTEGKIVVAAAAHTPEQAAFPASVAGVIVADAAEGNSLAEINGAVYAPGADILVAVPGGSFDYASGSSLSAAHVSGVVALLVSRKPALTSADAGALLRSAVNPDGRSVSACRALASLLGVTGCFAPGLMSDNP